MDAEINREGREDAKKNVGVVRRLLKNPGYGNGV